MIIIRVCNMGLSRMKNDTGRILAESCDIAPDQYACKYGVRKPGTKS